MLSQKPEKCIINFAYKIYLFEEGSSFMTAQTGHIETLLEQYKDTPSVLSKSDT